MDGRDLDFRVPSLSNAFEIIFTAFLTLSFLPSSVFVVSCLGTSCSIAVGSAPEKWHGFRYLSFLILV